MVEKGEMLDDIIGLYNLLRFSILMFFFITVHNYKFYVIIWGFRISDLAINLDVTYVSPVVNFGEVRRAQLTKSTLLTSTLVPLGSFKIF